VVSADHHRSDADRSRWVPGQGHKGFL
jgi:hypothetical protein